MSAFTMSMQQSHFILILLNYDDFILLKITLMWGGTDQTGSFIEQGSLRLNFYCFSFL